MKFLRVAIGVVAGSGNVAWAGGQPTREAVREAEAESHRVATETLERYLAARGVDRPAADVFPRRTVLKVAVGDAAKVTKLDYLTDGRNYRLTTESPDGVRSTEISSAGGRIWVLSDVLGLGFLKESSAVAKALARGRPTLADLRREYTYWSRLPDVQHEGKNYRGVLMRRGLGGVEGWYFDPESDALLRIGPPPNARNSDEQSAIVREYRTIDGALEPFEITIRAGPQRIVQRTIAVENRVAVPRVAFEPPSKALAEWNRAEEILHRYVKSCGGVLALAQIVSRVSKSRNEVTTTGATFMTTMWQKLPNWVAVEHDMPGVGKSWEGIRGHDGWAVSELAGSRPMNRAELELRVRSTDLHNTEHFPAIYPFRALRGETDVGGRRAIAIDLANELGRAGTHHFDAETGRLLRIESVLSLPAGGTLPVTMDFSDFRTIDGIVLPFETITTNPAVRIVTKIESIQHNQELENTLFEPRKIE